MKLTIPKSDLSRLITGVGKVVESRNTIPILSNVLLTATADTLTVRGTDLDIEATASVAASCSPGAICVDAKLFAGIVAKAGGDISLQTEGDKLIVKSGRSRFSLQTLPAEDFPTMAGGTFDATFDIDLAALFAPVAFAISTEETRYYLNGVFFRGYDGKTVAVATDGHRLGRHFGAATADFEGVIVPRKTVSLLPKGTVLVSVSTNRIQISSADFVMTSKLIDGTFPDYERVIPKANDKIVTVDRDEMMKAADRVAAVSSERGKAVKLSIAPGGIALSASSEVGQAEDEVAAEYSGEPAVIGFNAGYLRDIMTVLPSGSVTLAIADGGSPGLITSAGFEGLTLVAMPMRV